MPGIPRFIALSLVTFCSLVGCSSQASDGETRGRSDPDVLVTIEGNAITMSDVREQAGDQLDRIEFNYESDRYQLIDAALERILQDRLLAVEAADRGISVDELIASVTSEVVQVTEDDVDEWYQDNKDRLGDRPLDELRSQIQAYLWQRARTDAVATLVRQIEESKDVVYRIEPFRAGFDLADAPKQGPADASVTLVEFSDFECPFCGRFFSTLQQIEANYGDRIRIVYMQYPLEEIHPRAFKAAEASLCAHEQDRFWEMHDLLFAEQDRLDVISLKEKAGRLGLDQEKFDRCLNSGRHAERIRRDISEGDRLGVEGTPAIFVNGIPLPAGAVPYETVASAIEKELRRASSR